MTIRVIVNGALGKMGQEVVNAVENDKELTLVSKTDKNNHLADEIKNTKANVVIDFTSADSAFINAQTIIEAGACPVIGTTGFLQDQIKQLQTSCAHKKRGGIIAPNFSIGAVLMMKLAKEAAQFFPHVEIIELHHDKKVDAPSGTAIKTAEMISDGKQKTKSTVQEKEILSGARGATKNDIHIHSIRLPGFLAHEEIIFGGLGQLLTLRHDTMSREAFMPGVLMACKKVVGLDHLVYGLENIL